MHEKQFSRRALMTSVYVEFMLAMNIPCPGANGIERSQRTEFGACVEAAPTQRIDQNRLIFLRVAINYR